MNRLPGELGRRRHGHRPRRDACPAAGRARPATSGPVDVLVRPEGLTVAAAEGGNGIVSGRTFLGAVTRVAVLLSGDTEVGVDLASAAALAMPPGTAVQVGLPPAPVLVAPPPAVTPARVSRRSGCGTTARARTAGTR